MHTLIEIAILFACDAYNIKDWKVLFDKTRINTDKFKAIRLVTYGLYGVTSREWISEVFFRHENTINDQLKIVNSEVEKGTPDGKMAIILRRLLIDVNKEKQAA